MPVPSKIKHNESIQVRFYNNTNSICNRLNSTLNSTVTYNLYEKLSPYYAEYLSADDINNEIKFLNNSLLGKDYNVCKLQTDPVLPYIGYEVIENKEIALKYCTIFSNKCIGIRSIDKNNVYWKLISNISMDNQNYDLVKDDTNTYISDNLNIQIENFDISNYPKIIPDPPFFVWTDNLAIKFIIAILIGSIIIYYYYYVKKLDQFSLFSQEN